MKREDILAAIKKHTPQKLTNNGAFMLIKAIVKEKENQIKELKP